MMQVWEYAILCRDEGTAWHCPSVPNLVVNPTDDDWEIANRLGGDGWELVSVEPDGGMWFKRPKVSTGGDPVAASVD